MMDFCLWTTRLMANLPLRKWLDHPKLPAEGQKTRIFKRQSRIPMVFAKVETSSVDVKGERL